jgi:hypothetical protein
LEVVNVRILVASILVFLCCLLLAPVAVGAGKMMMTSTTLKNSVTIDGKWTYPDEWTDGASYSAGTYGWLVIKDDSRFLYVLVDVTADRSATASDFAWIVWDQKNDGGSKPKSDDFNLLLGYVNKTSYTSSIAQGTGTDWATPTLASSLGILSASSADATHDPYSETSHLAYEFQVPRSILDNSTVITSIGFSAGAHDEPSGNWISFPLETRGDYYMIPDTWGQLTFSLPVPEFPNPLVMIFASIAAVLFVCRQKQKKTNA